MILCDSEPALSGVQPYRASHLVHPTRNSLLEQKNGTTLPSAAPCQVNNIQIVDYSRLKRSRIKAPKVKPEAKSNVFVLFPTFTA